MQTEASATSNPETKNNVTSTSTRDDGSSRTFVDTQTEASDTKTKRQREIMLKRWERIRSAKKRKRGVEITTDAEPSQHNHEGQKPIAIISPFDVLEKEPPMMTGVIGNAYAPCPLRYPHIYNYDGLQQMHNPYQQTYSLQSHHPWYHRYCNHYHWTNHLHQNIHGNPIRHSLPHTWDYSVTALTDPPLHIHRSTHALEHMIAYSRVPLPLESSKGDNIENNISHPEEQKVLQITPAAVNKENQEVMPRKNLLSVESQAEDKIDNCVALLKARISALVTENAGKWPSLSMAQRKERQEELMDIKRMIEGKHHRIVLSNNEHVNMGFGDTVSYTHLTLPTKRIV